MEPNKKSKENRASEASEGVQETAPGDPSKKPAEAQESKVEESGGPTGPDPTRYGDWERKGRFVDF